MAQVGGGRPWRVRAGHRSAAGPSPWPFAGAAVRQLEAEQDRWFLWLPVLFGSGIALYFALPVEPSLSVAVLPVGAALALRLSVPSRGTGVLLGAALLAFACGVAAEIGRAHV